MTNLDDALDAAETVTNPLCKYAQILAGVTDEQRERIEALPPATAGRALRAAELTVSDDVIRRHRHGHKCG